MKKLPCSPPSGGDGGGFNLIPLPPAPPPSHSKLRRTSSLPTDSGAAPSPDSAIGLSSSSLFRTASDPIPFISHSSPPNNIVGPRVPSSSRSPASGSDSPASKRLKRMSERMKEMRHWFDELIHQSDQDCDSETGDDDDDAEDINETKNVDPEEVYEEHENTVTADRQGDAVNIRFQCPCGDAYHILLLGQDYYYKLH